MRQRSWNRLSLFKYVDTDHLEDRERLGGKICRRNKQVELGREVGFGKQSVADYHRPSNRIKNELKWR